MSFQLTLHKVLSDPSFQPLGNLFELNLRGSFKDLLESCSAEMCARFAIGEAWLVLPIFEAAYPDDSRPRDAIVAAEEWLKNSKVAYSGLGTNTVRAADAAHAAANVAHAAANVTASAAATAAAEAGAGAAAYAAEAAYAVTAAYAASTAYHVALAAKLADSNIALMDQLRRLLNEKS